VANQRGAGMVQDLLGFPLEMVAHEMCLPGTLPDDHRIDNAERQVRFWMQENRPPKIGDH